MNRAAAHAGRLHGRDRLAFGLAFAVMAVAVTIATMTEAKAGLSLAAGRPASPAAAAAASPPPSGTGVRADARTAAGRGQRGNERISTAKLNRRLAASLALVLRHRRGQIAVAIMDASTGIRAVYHAGRSVRAASIVGADILASLLLAREQSQTPLGGADAALATQMIEHGSHAATRALWRAAGGGAGLVAANAVLGLRNTGPAADAGWALTKTTASDQLRLLDDLVSAASPLRAAARDYQLALMQDAGSGQRWAAPAAAGSAAPDAVMAGCLPDPRLWVTTSIGLLNRGGQQLLIAVLSTGSPTRAAGQALVRAATQAAVDVVLAAAAGVA